MHFVLPLVGVCVNTEMHRKFYKNVCIFHQVVSPHVRNLVILKLSLIYQQTGDYDVKVPYPGPKQ